MLFESNRGARRWAAQVAKCWLVVTVVLGVCVAAYAGEGFRIETKIFVGEEKEPASSATTLFLEGVVYDFLANPEQTAVFRKATGDKPGRFILLDDKNRVQTEVSTEELTGAMKKLRTWASRQNNPFLQFCANPKFDETFDRDNGKLVLASHLETYTVETRATQHQDSLGEYREFLDWYAQLNTLLTAGNPPYPRLQLNDALARHKVVPDKVELKREGQDLRRAEHDFTWRLSQDDLQRIEDVRAALTSYKKVDNRIYLSQKAQ